MESPSRPNPATVSRRHKYPFSAIIASLLGTCTKWSGLQRLLLHIPATHLVYLHHTFDFNWLDELLRDLSRDFQFVDHDAAVQRIRSGQHPKPAISFSFDDGFASCKGALEVLERYETRGLIYVCPGLVGRDNDGVTQFFGAPQPEGVLDWDALCDIKSRGHRIGSHTINHRNMAKLSTAELTEELQSSRDIIQGKLGTCDHFAWPFGRKQFFSPEAFRIAVDSGYRSIASGIRGGHRTASQGMLYRHVIHPGQSSVSLKQFLALSLAGLDGHARSRTWLDGLRPETNAGATS